MLRPPRPADWRNFYESLSELYPADDKWHAVTHNWIVRFIKHRFTASLQKQTVLNVGSGGQSFGIPEATMLHVDLHRNGFTKEQSLFIADIQSLPDLGRSFDYCICVGSVINHCDAGAAIVSIHKALSQDATLILEYESSWSLEFCGTPIFKKSAMVVRTTYQNRGINLWVYSPQYIEGLLRAAGFVIMARAGKHYISPGIYRIWPNPNVAAGFHLFDGIARHIPLLNRYAHNVIVVCRKCG
jgi:hypothetical protein